eukprot:gene17660-5257_t
MDDSQYEPKLMAWFTKKAEKFGLSKKRWFVLNDEAGVCAYYSSEGSTEEDMKGAINLSDVASATVKGKDLVISTGAGRVYTLTGADKAKSTEWAMALTRIKKQYAAGTHQNLQEPITSFDEADERDEAEVKEAADEIARAEGAGADAAATDEVDAEAEAALDEAFPAASEEPAGEVSEPAAAEPEATLESAAAEPEATVETAPVSAGEATAAAATSAESPDKKKAAPPPPAKKKKSAPPPPAKKKAPPPPAPR